MRNVRPVPGRPVRVVRDYPVTRTAGLSATGTIVELQFASNHRIQRKQSGRLAVALLAVLCLLTTSVPAQAAPAPAPDYYDSSIINLQDVVVEPLSQSELENLGVNATEPSVSIIVIPKSGSPDVIRMPTGETSSSLNLSKYGCGVAIMAVTVGWGSSSGSGTIGVDLDRNGANFWTDSRSFSGGYGSYPRTDFSNCGSGEYRLRAWATKKRVSAYATTKYRTVVC